MIDLNNLRKSDDPRRIDLDGRILVAHQAEFMPWLGFISKATMGDIYLILDDTQFKKKNFQNRNKIRFPNKDGWLWLNVPIKNKDKLQNMLDVEFSDFRWKQKHLESIKTSYVKAPNFERIFNEISRLYENFELNKLVDFNIEIIRYAFKKFNIQIPLIKVSDLKRSGVNISGCKSDLVLSLGQSVNANTIIVGSDGGKYLDYKIFKDKSIQVVIQKFNHPVYSQIHGSFKPNMCFLDLLFNQSEKDAVRILGKSHYIKFGKK